jgi:hypothetical protein
MKQTSLLGLDKLKPKHTMDRKSFLRRFGGMVGVGIFAPQLLKGVEIEETETVEPVETVEPIIKAEDFHYKFRSDEDRLLTEKFFDYLNNNNVGFVWERVTTPAFTIEDKKYGYKPAYVNTRKLRTNFNALWKEGFTSVESESLSASTITHRKYDTLDQYYDVIFFSVAQELRNQVIYKHVRKHYIYQLMFTPTMYNPFDFSPTKGIMIRSLTT